MQSGATSYLDTVYLNIRNKEVYDDCCYFYTEIIQWEQIDSPDPSAILFETHDLNPKIALRLLGSHEIIDEIGIKSTSVLLEFKISYLERLKSHMQTCNYSYKETAEGVIMVKDPNENDLVFYDINASIPTLYSTLQGSTTLEGLKIALLTSGGDSQGMNAAIRAIVRMGIYRNCIPYMIYEGYQGLIEGGNKIKLSSWNDVGQIISLGGTVIGTARCAEFMERNGRLLAVANLLRIGIHSLIVIGGDGSLTGAEVLREEWPGLVQELSENAIVSPDVAQAHPFLNVVGLVGSIDNDMVGTDLTIGANTSLHRIIEAIDCISTSASSHSRTFIIEVMGRHCGWLALMAAVASDADWLLIPEVPCIPGEWEIQMTEHIARNRKFGKRASIVVVSEGAIDTNNIPIKPKAVLCALKQRLALEARITTLGHVQRGGSPSAYDRILASFQGMHAVDALLESERRDQKDSIMIGIQENQIVWLSLAKAVKATRDIEKALQGKNFTQAFELRDPDFKCLYNLVKKTVVHHDHGIKDTTANLNHKTFQEKRLAMIHCGAPAGGMNTAAKSFVRYCLCMNYTPIALYDGWDGALSSDDNVKVLDWMDVDGWVNQGGSNIGTNRSMPKDLSLISRFIERHCIHGLVIVGGYEAYRSLKILHHSRKQLPALNIPMVCIPATISNNVPGTEYSLGTDTALNMIVNSCDAIRQSASSTRRVFVVEVQGGHCGYLALYSGLATGATYAYLPEEGIRLSDIIRDSKHLKSRFLDNKKQGRLLIMNEHASSTYSAEMIANILKDESEGLFDARTSKLGHLQQGGRPSPFDRIQASRLAVLSIQYIENSWNLGQAQAALVGIQNGQVVFSPVEELEEQADDLQRRPKHPWWWQHRPMAKILSKYPVPQYPIPCMEGKVTY